MTGKHACACGAAPKLIFVCSGSSDVGAIADQAARKLAQDGVGKMYCLAGIGGRVSGIMESTKSAAKILAIDGCPVNCARKMLELAGFKQIEHLTLSDIGLQKGQSPVTPENVNMAARKAAPLLRC